jgi:hypothetical protein
MAFLYQAVGFDNVRFSFCAYVNKLYIIPDCCVFLAFLLRFSPIPLPDLFILLR